MNGIVCRVSKFFERAYAMALHIVSKKVGTKRSVCQIPFVRKMELNRSNLPSQGGIGAQFSHCGTEIFLGSL